ncbi:LysR family transcriptional regulator [Rhizobium sp. SSA_523]|uniref:LysR family transcriptional regulator n=1 Tax=Rhizobium sp. SSA_523 TaxID=2952477 RepID=UPI002090A2E4|nr:LysR family transcriptional regulator [Rhizobium sp. SSA_523]MCO5734010.1 LysR family transcriptional regulator [Rhizobium sp. SSA_523]WKC25880.1 LysR family transcriptional regulator [Rhizobium sp. SSA_523]
MEPNPTLDQLQVFLAVAEAGSFSAAARNLNRAQSVISYTISNLEAQLEVSLFERNGTRQTHLTEAGKAMLADSRRIVSDLQIMRARAKALKQGLEAEVSLAISTMVPTQAVVETLSEFGKLFPSVALSLNSGELGMVMDMVLSGKASVGVGGMLMKQDDSLTVQKIGHSYMVPVAAYDHPLAQLGRPLTRVDVREEVQLVVTDASGITQGQTFNVLSYKIWRVSDIATKHQLIRGGLGWGGLPASLILEDLASGRLCPLKIDAYETAEYPLYAIRRIADSPGPATLWLINSLAQQLSRCPNLSSHELPLHSFEERRKALAAE